jgi:hypothetical protein
MSRPTFGWARGFAVAVWLLTVACARPAPQAEAPPVAPTAAVALLPTPTPAPTPAQAIATETPIEAPTEAPDWTQFAAQEGDYYVLGNPNAPIRLLDYSDFL